MLQTRRAIVNADDFGFSPGISEGILRAYREGIVTSTTIVANIPAAEDAVRMLVEAPELGVGVHLNASQGPPLSKAGRVLAGPDGTMAMSAARVIGTCALRPALLDAVAAECEAQIQWVLDHGIRPTHLDSHRHTYAFGPIFARVAALARRYHIRFVRRHREVLPGRWPAAPIEQRCLSCVMNVFALAEVALAPDLLATHGTWGVAHTGHISAGWLLCAARALPGGITEIMTHPGLGDGLDANSTRLLASRAKELEALCAPAVTDAFRNGGIELTHYGKL